MHWIILITFMWLCLGDLDSAVTVNFRNGCGILSGKTILLPYSLVITRLKAPSRESTAGGDMGAAEQIHGWGHEERSQCCGRFPGLPNLWRGCGAEEVTGSQPAILRWQCSRGPGSQPPPRVQSLWWAAPLASGSGILCACAVKAAVPLHVLFVMSPWRVVLEPPGSPEAALINSSHSILHSPAETHSAWRAQSNTARDALPCHYAHLFCPVELIFKKVFLSSCPVMENTGRINWSPRPWENTRSSDQAEVCRANFWGNCYCRCAPVPNMGLPWCLSG